MFSYVKLFRPYSFLSAFVTLLIAALFSSCNTYKNIKYFKDIPDSLKTDVASVQYQSPVIQPDDIISISIQTIDPLATQGINQSNIQYSVLGANSASPAGNQLGAGYLVDKEGIVSIPIAGKIKVAGLTTSEAKETIRKKVATFYKDPIVDVRFSNFKITVVGEVNKPATYVVPNEKVSILDAIGLAGDLTIFGKRENVLLIRDENGTKQFVRFDLTSSKVVKSPYFYLKQNDYIYVEPTKAKIANLDAERTRTFTIIASVLSLFIVIASRR